MGGEPWWWGRACSADAIQHCLFSLRKHAYDVSVSTNAIPLSIVSFLLPMAEIREAATQNPLTLPDITEVSNASTDTRAQILDLLFEPCIQLHTLSVSLLNETKFPTYSALVYDGVGKQLKELLESELHSDQEWLDKILEAHPRLGEKKGGMSANSTGEQAAMNREGEGPEVAEKLRHLNEEYEKAFGGLRYV